MADPKAPDTDSKPNTPDVYSAAFFDTEEGRRAAAGIRGGDGFVAGVSIGTQNHLSEEEKRKEEDRTAALIEAAAKAAEFAKAVADAGAFWEANATAAQKAALSNFSRTIADPSASPQAKAAAMVEGTGVMAEVQAQNPNAPQDPEDFAALSIAAFEEKHVEEQVRLGRAAEDARAEFRAILDSDPALRSQMVAKAMEFQAAHQTVQAAALEISSRNQAIAATSIQIADYASQKAALERASQIYQEELQTAEANGTDIDMTAFVSRTRAELGDENFQALTKTYMASMGDTINWAATNVIDGLGTALAGVSDFVNNTLTSLTAESDDLYQQQFDKLEELREQRAILEADAANPIMGAYIRTELAKLDQEITNISDELRSSLNTELADANTWYQKELDAMALNAEMDPDMVGAGTPNSGTLSAVHVPGTMTQEALGEVHKYQLLLADLDSALGIKLSPEELVMQATKGRTEISHYELVTLLEKSGLTGAELESETLRISNLLNTEGQIIVASPIEQQDAPAPTPPTFTPDPANTVALVFTGDNVDARQVENYILENAKSLGISESEISAVKALAIHYMRDARQTVHCEFADPVTGICSGKPPLGPGLQETDPSKGLLSSAFGAGAAPPALEMPALALDLAVTPKIQTSAPV